LHDLILGNIVGVMSSSEHKMPLPACSKLKTASVQTRSQTRLQNQSTIPLEIHEISKWEVANREQFENVQRADSSLESLQSAISM